MRIRLPRSILTSVTSIVVLAIGALVAVILAHGLSNGERRVTFERLNGIQSTQTTLALISKEAATLRYWDQSARILDLSEVLKQRAASIERLENHIAAFNLYVAESKTEIEPLSVLTGVGTYLEASNRTAELWKIFGRQQTEGLQFGLLNQIERLRAIESQINDRSAKDDIIISGRALSSIFHQIGVITDLAPLEDPLYKSAAIALSRTKQSIERLGDPQLKASALPLLSLDNTLAYMEARRNLSNAFRVRQQAYQRLESALNPALLQLIGEQRSALTEYETGRRRSYQIVTYGCLFAILLIATFGRIVARRMAQDKQQLIRLSRENFDVVSALDSANDKIIIEGADGRITYINQAVADAWNGGSKGGLVGQSFHDKFPKLAERSETIEQEPRYSPNQQNLLSMGVALEDARGDELFFDARVSKLPDNGKLHTLHDVTQRRLQERHELLLREQLSESRKLESIGRLAGGIAHDFNNIIAAIRAFAALAQNGVDQNSDASRFISRVTSTCDRAADLVRSILSFSKASHAELRPLNAIDVIQEVEAYIGTSMPANISIKIYPLSSPVSVLGNSGQLVQVFLNLGINARDAMGQKPGAYRDSDFNQVVARQRACGLKARAFHSQEQPYRRRCNSSICCRNPAC